MSDKNLQASVELQVNTPGAEKVTQLKKEITELLAALGAAGVSTSTSLDKAGAKIAALSAKAESARGKELTAEQAHARKLELLEKQKEMVATRQFAKRAEQSASIDKRIEAERERHANKLAAMDRKAQVAKDAAEAKRAQLATTADAKILASANNLAAVQAQILARQEAAADAAHQRRLSRLQALATAEARRSQSNDLARLRGITEQDRWANGGRVANPVAAWDMAHKENAVRGVAAAEAAGLAQANSFGGRFKSAMTNWGRSASESFVQSFKSSMSGGMGTAIAGIGALVGVRSAVRDNMLYQEMKNQITLSAGSEEAGAKEFEYVHGLAVKNGRDIKFIGEEYAKFSNSAKLAGASIAETHKIFTGVMDYAAAWHLSDAKVKRAMAIDLTEPLDMGHFNGAILNRSMPANLPGAKQLLQQAFMKENNLDEHGWKNAVSKGQVSGLGSELLMAEAMSKSVAKKLADANKSAQAELGRLLTAFRDFNVQMGAMGAFDGFTRALRALSAVFNDTGFQAAFAGLARGVASFSEALAPAITYVGEFIKKHPVMVEWMGRWLALGGALRVGLALLGTAVSILISPVMLLAGAVFTTGSRFKEFTVAAKLLMTPVTALAVYLGGPLVAAFRGVQVASAAGMGGLVMFRTGVDGVKTSLARMMSVAVLAAGALAAFNIGKGVFDQRSADQSMEKGGRDKMSRDELVDHSAILGKAISNVDNASGAGDVPLAKRAARKKLLAEQKQSYDIQLALLDKQEESALTAKTTATIKKATDEAAAAAEDGKAHPSLGEGRHKGKKGRSGSAQAGDLASSMKEEADKAYAGRMERIKSEKDAAEAALDEQLESATVSYNDFYAKKRKLVDDAAAEEKDALEKKVAGDIAAERLRLSHAKDGSSRQASAIRLKTLEAELTDKIAAAEQRRLKGLSAIEMQQSKTGKAVDKRFAQLRSESNRLNGRIDSEVANAGIDESHEADLSEATRADPSGARGLANDVAETTAAEKAAERIKALQERAGERAVELANKEAEVQLQVLQGLSSKADAEGQILKLKKDQARENIKLLEQAAAMKNPLSVQLKIEKDLLDNKMVLEQHTARQVELEQAATAAMSGALQQVVTGTKGIGSALKDALKSVNAGIVKMLTDDWSQKAMGWMKGAAKASAENPNGGILGKSEGIVGSLAKGGASILGSMFGFGDTADGKDVDKMVVKNMRVEGGLSATLGAGGSEGGSGVVDGLMSYLPGMGGDVAAGASSGSSVSSAIGGIASFFGFAEGGAVFGAGSGTSDSVNAKLSHGEYVFTAKDVNALGGAGALDAMRKSLHGYAGGGPITAAGKASTGSAGGVARMAGNAAGVVMNISTPDAGSFRAAESQILSRMQLASQRAQRRNY
ncbi:MAG: hypothetical protein M3Y65_24860 [Pseudomonadota bacterium]|nr:hypothetical protein [Pseudomonadota bacterium]